MKKLLFAALIFAATSCTKSTEKAALQAEETTEINALNAEAYFFKSLKFSEYFSNGYRVCNYTLQNVEELHTITLVNDYYGNRNNLFLKENRTFFWCSSNDRYYWSIILANGKNIITSPKYPK